MKKQRIAIYCRVSTATGEQTTENQKRLLIKHAQRQDWDFEIFEETQSTRKSLPIKQKVLTALRQNEFDAILVYRLDRYGRSLTNTVLEIKELVDKGKGFYSLTENLDFSTATGILQFQILSVFAEYERNLISSRTKDGLARVKAQGTKLGRPVGVRDSVPRKKEGYLKRYQTVQS